MSQGYRMRDRLSPSQFGDLAVGDRFVVADEDATLDVGSQLMAKTEPAFQGHRPFNCCDHVRTHKVELLNDALLVHKIEGIRS